MYTVDDIRKMQASMGLTVTGEGGGSTKKYTAEDVVKIQRQNAEKGREQLRLEGRAPSVTQAISGGRSAYDLALEQYREDRISDPMEELARWNGEKEPQAPQEGPGFASDKFDRWITETGQKMDQKYSTVAQWYGEAGTEQNERRHALMRDLKNAYADVARKVESGELEKTGTIWAMANQQVAEKGYSRGEISTARQIMGLEKEMGIYDDARRVGQTARSIVASVASAIPQGIENVKQGVKNTEARQALIRESENRNLALTVDTVMNLGSAPEEIRREWYSKGIYGLDDLVQKNKEGWTEEEILSMAAALEGTAAPVSQDTLGYRMYQTGQAALEDAMRGESEGQRFLHSAATSAGENVVLAAINPALVLPVMTAQTVADSLGEATASGQTPGHALASAGLKAGIGWIIEEAGVAQMAQNMGKKFAASALSEKMLDFIHSAPGMEVLQQSAPVLYGIAASGADEAVEEFVESYADKLVDVALGDAQASELLSLEQLAEAGMGAAGGALGGAMIGGASTGIGMLSGAYSADRAGNSGPVELAPEAPAVQAQQKDQASQTQTPASAALSQKLDAVQAAVEPAAQMARQALEEPQQAAQAQQTVPAQNQEWEATPLVGQDGQLGANDWEQLAARQAALRAQAEAANPGMSPAAPALRQEAMEAAPAAPEVQKAREVTEAPYWTREQRQEARLLAENSSMTPEAVELVVDAMPQDISGEVYTPAARMIYQIARQGLAETEAEALALAGKSGAMVPQVLAVPGGAEALHQAWNQGRIEGLEASGYGRAGMAPAETAGTVAMEEGAFLPEEDKNLLDLSAAASDTAVTVREKLENNAGGYINTALGQIYFAAEEGRDTFGTVLHEQTHLYNALDPEGGRILQTNVLKALAESQGYEQVDSLIQSYIQRYQEAGQTISYAQACEEVAADAWRGIFGSVESFTRWAQRQAAQAEKNAESRGTIRKMVDAVKDILDNVIQRAKQILAREPENTAARWAMELAEDQKRALEEEYYQHQDAALEAQRNARRDSRAPAANQTAEQTGGRRAAQLREGETAAERTAKERRAEESGRKAKAPQAGWTGKGDAAYDTLTALPDMEITPIDTRAVEGKNYREIVADAFENMGAGRQATKATVTNRYTGMEITVGRRGIEHSFHGGRDIEVRASYVQQIGSILENAVKVNELNGRTGPKGRGEDHSDVYLGAAENEKGELVGVRLIVNVYENGRAELDAASLESETGRLYAHAGTKIGSAEAPPKSATVINLTGLAAVSNAVHSGTRTAAEMATTPTISIAELITAVNETKRAEGRKNVVNWLEGVLSEDVRRRIGSGVTAPIDMADSLRYQLPVDNTPAENGQKAAAWENVDRGELEQAMTEAYQEKNVRRVPVENLREMARRLLKDTQSKENQITLAKKLENLAGYLSGGKVDGRTALTMAEDIAESLMRKSGRRSTELWDQYPDLRYHTLYVQRGGTEYKEVVSQYGKFGIAQKELAKYGITLTTGESHKDSAVDVVYESLSREYPGLFPAEITDPMKQIDTIAEVRDAISIKYQNNFGENWEEAKADLAMQILGGMVREGVTDRTAAGTLIQRIDENLNRHRLEIRERTVRELDLQERRIRRDAYRSAKRIVDEAGKANLARSERDQKKIQELEAVAQRRAEAWAKTKGNLRTALASSRNSLQRARDARNKDALKRQISTIVTRLNRMAKHPNKNGHIPEGLYSSYIEFAKFAARATKNEEAYNKAKDLEIRLNSLAGANGQADGASSDWQASGIAGMMQNLRESMETGDRQSQFDQQENEANRRIEQGLDFLYQNEAEQAALADEIEYGMEHLNVEQLRMIRDIGSAILTISRNENKLLSIRSSRDASEMAEAARQEVRTSFNRRKKGEKGIRKTLKKWGDRFNENTLNARDEFLRLGGYRDGGAMDTLGKMLADGEARKDAIVVEGLMAYKELLADAANFDKFTGANAELVDLNQLGFKVAGQARITRGQKVTLWLALQNQQNRNHLLNGGIIIPDMEALARGDYEEARQNGVLVRVVKDPETYKKSLVSLEASLSDYERQWMEKARETLDKFCPDYINGTSMAMYGFKKATVEDYIPIVVGRDYVRDQNEGLKFNGTIEGRGFLKERRDVANEPVILEDIVSVVMKSLSDTAAYAGQAMGIRDFDKVWNADVKTGNSLRTVVTDNYGAGAAKYIKQYLEDLQKKPTERDSLLAVQGNLLGKYAGAVLTLNPSVALGQYSGIFNAGAELGAGKPMQKAVAYMTRRLPGVFGVKSEVWVKEAEELDSEMVDFGYMGLESIKSTGATVEMNEIRKQRGLTQKIMEHSPGVNWMEDMDLETRRGCWIGSKEYVAGNLDVYSLTQEDADTRSNKFKAAVVSKMTDVINNTQPNYTISQRAAMQRHPGRMEKAFTMFKTQGLRNYGLTLTAIDRVRAQRQYQKELIERLKNRNLDEETAGQARKELDWVQQQLPKSEQTLRRVVGSQLISTAVYAAISLLVKDVLLHRLDRDKDENGEFTIQSVGRRYLSIYMDATTGNVLFLPEALAIAGNLFGFRDEEPVSIMSVDALDDLAADLYSFRQTLVEEDKDLLKIMGRFKDLSESIGNVIGLPIGQAYRMGEALYAWTQDIVKAAASEDISLGDILTAPESSSSQYDDLYTAVFETENPEDAAAALAALEKLDKLNPPKKPGDAKAGDTKILSELLKREKEFGILIRAAAAARITADNADQQKLMQMLVNTLAKGLGIDKNTGGGRRRLTTVINKVNAAISDEMRARMGADSKTGATIYTPVLNALETGSGLAEAQAVLRRAGITDEDIRSAVVSAYKEDYLYSDEAGRKAIEAKLLRLKDAKGDPYFVKEEKKYPSQEVRNDFADWVTDWTLKGFNDSVYTDLDEALQTRNQITAQEEIYRYMEAGKSAGSIRDRITALFKDEYLKASPAQRQEIAKFLVRLRGPKGEKLVTVDTLTGWIKDEAKKKAGR